ncbi:MFS transporter [Peredibacter starrii]|uniref:MFS transporter n=1 Tax=Peredibacter starrii TaxID=28202 RepID=A0AAX4HLQ0_9BACT|nr:MFS transporter [Peredibacter starrii]WPU64100.1 MFS transporter [Peredibacter starrii]
MFQLPFGLKKLVLNFNLLTFGANQLLLFSLFPILAMKLGLSISIIALAFSFGTLIFLWGSPYWSNRADLENPHRVLFINVTGLFVSLVFASLIFFLEKSFTMTTALMILLMGRISYGALASGIPAISQSIRLSYGQEMMKSMFSHSAYLNVGRTLGPCLLLLPFSTQTIIHGLTIWGAVLWFLNLIVMMSEKEPSEPKTSKKRPSPFVVSKELILPIALTMSFGLYTGMLHSSLGQKISLDLALNAEAASTFMAKLLLSGTIIMAVVQIVGSTLFKNNWRVPLSVGILAMTVGALLISFLPSELSYWAGIAGISLGIAFLQPSNITFMESLGLGGETRGQRLGQLASFNTLSYALGGILAAIGNHQLVSVLILGLLIVSGVRILTQVEVKVC